MTARGSERPERTGNIIDVDKIVKLAKGNKPWSQFKTVTRGELMPGDIVVYAKLVNESCGNHAAVVTYAGGPEVWCRSKESGTAVFDHPLGGDRDSNNYFQTAFGKHLVFLRRKPAKDIAEPSSPDMGKHGDSPEWR